MNAGSGTEAQYQGLRSIAHILVEREGIDAILLAGTELALIFNEGNLDFPHVDCARVHLDAIMRELTQDRGQ